MSDPHNTHGRSTQIPANHKADPEATGVYSPVESAADLVRVLDQYLADLQAGHAPDKARLLAEHPDLARQLEDCLAGIEFVHRAASPATEAPAQLGDFRIVREVGRGGMGVVYEAEQRSLKRKVALKVLRFGVTADAEVMQRFQREAETVAHLHHTNIVPIHAVGCEQGVHYYAMQFIEGQSLAAFMEDRQQAGGVPPGAADFKEIAGMVLQAAEALTHAHQRGVIHRDIKPSNLIRDPQGTVWLTDFGLAKRANEVTMTAAGVLMGTPRYMSPEQAAAAAQPVDHRTDIYSLGATLYELATGKPVFDSQTPQGVITQILTADPVSPRLLQGKLPRDLETIILKCLAKEPARRYQQARDLADDLRAYLDNRAIRARRATPVERAVRWARKHQRSTNVAAMTAAASLLLVAGGFWGWTAYQESLLGRLVLTTEGPSLIAEVLDDQDNLVTPSFPVPTPQPVVLPAGSYRVRLSSAGTLSETWQMDVARGQQHSQAVKILDRLMWPPLEVLSRDPPALVELNGRAHLLVGGERGWRVLDGATAKRIWPDDFKLPDQPMAPTGSDEIVNWEEWRTLMQGYSESGGYASPSTGNSPGIAQPAADLDGDQRDDLVFAARTSPALLAVSINDGRLLWTFRSIPELPPEHDAVADPLDLQASRESGGVIGQPLMVNVNGAPVVIAVFVTVQGSLQTKGGKVFQTANRYWVEAIAARDGKSLWRAPLNVPGLAERYFEAIPQFPTRLEVVKLDGRQTLLLPAGAALAAFDLHTGKEVWPTHELGFRPVQAPRFTDLDGDGQPEVVYLYKKSEDSEELVLRAVALNTRDTLWERPFRCSEYVQRNETRASGAELAYVADLEGDGKSEIVVPVMDDWSRFGAHWSGVELLEGATGAPRWQRRLCSLGTFAGSGGAGSVRAILGPDLDGDRQAEIYVASITNRLLVSDVDSPALQVDALSGKDGAVLWRRRLHAATGSSPFRSPGRLQWWQAGQDNWPQLVVSVDDGNGGQAMTYVMSAGSGRLAHVLPEVSDPQVADLNSDGIGDLFHLSGPQGSRRLTALQGLPPVDWRRPGLWQPGKDYDGDGDIDLLELREDGLIAHSGRDGRGLFRAAFSASSLTADSALTHADLNGDAIADVVVMVNEFGPNGNFAAVAALSGRDGQRLWVTPDFGLRGGTQSSSGGGAWSNYRYPLLDQEDLDGDGQAEILLAAQLDDSLGLAALSSADGSLLWKIHIAPGAYTGQSLTDRHIFYDLNADGVLDVVLWTAQAIDPVSNPFGVGPQAFSGRDGKPLWPDASPERINRAWHLWPRPAIADLDAEVVVTTNDGKGYDSHTQGYNCALVVLDGQTGHRKWSWPWVSLELNSWPPLLVSMDGDGTRTICMGISERTPTGTDSRIVTFRPTGEIRQSIPIRQLDLTPAWAALDVDTDGKEELLYFNESQLLAYRGSDQSLVWKRPLASHGLTLEQPRTDRKESFPTLVAREGRTVSGLNPATGAFVWRCQVPKQDIYQVETELVDAAGRDVPPLILTRHAGRLPTTAQRAWPTTADGAYLAPSVQPIAFAEFLDPNRFKPLPWSRGVSWQFRRAFGIMELLAFLCFLFTLLRWMRKARWWRVCGYLGLLVLISAGIGIMILRNSPGPLDASERYSWDGWYWILYFGGICLGVSTVIAAIGMQFAKLARRLIERRARNV